MDPEQFQGHVIEPALQRIELYSADASNLLLGTALAESGLHTLVQDGGPALGFYQIEPDTHDDIWATYLAYRQGLAARVGKIMWSGGSDTLHDQLISNLAYATAIARIKYLRDPEPIPAKSWEQAAYWKRVYNTEKGAGTIEHYLAAWKAAHRKE